MQTLIQLLADGILLVLISIAVPILVWEARLRMWQAAPIVIMAGLTSLGIGKLMSLIYQPAVARPFLELGLEPGAAYIDNPGFPSDHALLGTVLVCAIYAFTKNKKLVLFLGGLVLLMGIGRVFALVHTPLDVIGGVIAGLSGYLWYRKLTK